MILFAKVAKLAYYLIVKISSVKSKKISKFNNGFTLVELLVVIAIIGLLASVILVAVNTSRIKARDAKRLTDLAQITKALEIYYSQNGTYPPYVSSDFVANWKNMYAQLEGSKIIADQPTKKDG